MAGVAWRGMAWQGMAGVAGPGGARHGEAWLGMAGVAGPGGARLGQAGQDNGMNGDFTNALRETLDELSDGITSGRLSPVEWHNAVARELFVHHLATYASASGKDELDVLKDVKKIVGNQVDYLNKFTDDVDRGRYDDLPDALKARSALYVGAIRGTYYSAKYPGLDKVPGDGQTACLTNCKCSLIEKDDGVYWELAAAEHCEDCQAMAAGGPYESRS